MADAWWRVSPAMGEAAARELIYRIGPDNFTARVLLAWTRSPERRARRGLARARDAAAALERAGVSAQGGGFHRARRREGPARSARRSPRAEEAWIAAGFPMDAAALARIADDALGG